MKRLHNWFQFDRRMIIGIISQLGLIAGVIVLYFVYPVTYVRLIAEDQPGEFASFVAPMIACCLFAKLFFSRQTKMEGLWYFLLGIGTFLIAMEEISWGQRILHIGTPHFMEKINFQQEIGLHNIRALSPDKLTYVVVGLSFTVYGFFFPIFTIVFSRINKIVQRLSFPLPSLCLSPLFISTTYFLAFSILAKSEEIGELFMGISLGCLAIDHSLPKLELLKQDKLKKMIGDIAIPAFIAFTLIIGLLMTLFWGSTYMLKDNLNAFSKRLPSIGHNQQAEAIISYLKKHPKLADKDLLISKGRLLSQMNRWEEASAVFKEALDLEFRRLIINPKKPETLLRIANIYSEMDNIEGKIKYLKATLNIYEEKLATTDSSIELSKLYIARAKIYERIGNFSQSIEEYLKASGFVSNAYIRNEIESGIGYVFSLCRPNNIRNRKRVPWKEIQSMARRPDRSKIDWCMLSAGKYSN